MFYNSSHLTYSHVANLTRYYFSNLKLFDFLKQFIIIKSPFLIVNSNNSGIISEIENNNKWILTWHQSDPMEEASRSACAAALEASRAAALKFSSSVWLEATTRSTVPFAFWRIPMACWWLICESRGWPSMARIWKSVKVKLSYVRFNLKNYNSPALKFNKCSLQNMSSNGT